MKKQNIDLLFDLGGVIMNIEKERCVRSLKKLGMEHPEEFLGDYGQKGPFLALEEGKLTPAGFREALREYLPAGVTDEQIDDAFNDFLVGIPVERLKELEKLHRNHRIFLLSNTNKIMWDSKIAEEFGRVLASFDVKCCKPEAAIFEEAAGRFGLTPATTLFFDDSRENCEAAAELGFRTAWVRPGTEFTDYLPAPEK